MTVLQFGPGRDQLARRARAVPEPLWREVAGDVLKGARLQQHRTLRQVADRAGLSPQYLSEIERGRKEPSSEMLASLCGALGLTLADLLNAAAPMLVARTSAPFAEPAPRSSGSVSPVRAAHSGVMVLAA